MGAAHPLREIEVMPDTRVKPKGALINENATVDDLKAKKERQQVPTNSNASAPAKTETSAVQLPALVAKSTEAEAKSIRPDRIGKRLIAGYFPDDIRKALKHISVDEGLTLQQVMADAFALYLKSKGRDVTRT